MFGAIVAGRLQTNLQQVDNNRFVFELPNVESINHIVVFLTGAVAFPDGVGATVHYLYPGKSDWQILGMLSNSKPSAIFRLKGRAGPSLASSPNGLSGTGNNQGVATLGILVEDIGKVEEQVAAIHPQQQPDANALALSTPSSSSSNPPTDAEVVNIAMKVAKNFYNFLSSFVPDTPPGQPTATITAADLGQALERWMKTFENKIRNGGLSWLNSQE